MLKIELGGSGGSQSGDHAQKVAVLSDGVDYYHDGIFPIGFQEFDYKINTGSVPRCIQNWEGRNSPDGGWRANLVRKHMLQVEMYLHIYLDICGHQ